LLFIGEAMRQRVLVWVACLSLFALILAGLWQRAAAQTVRIEALPPSYSPHRATALTTVEFGGTLGFVYSPNDIFITPGDSIKWLGDFTMHPLVSDESLWTTVNTGSEFTFTFNQPGIYHFHCFFHGALLNMKGTVTVGFRNFIPVVIH
jgi:plastocyanin